MLVLQNRKHSDAKGKKAPKRGRYPELGEKLFAYRELHGLTQAVLASRLNVKRSIIYGWERGHIGIRFLPLIRNLLGEGVNA